MLTCRFRSTSSWPALDPKTASISSSETLAVSGTQCVDQTYPTEHAAANTRNVPLAERSMNTGVSSPIRTTIRSPSARPYMI